MAAKYLDLEGTHRLRLEVGRAVLPSARPRNKGRAADLDESPSGASKSRRLGRPPPSTNVSSPVSGLSKKRKGKSVMATVADEEDEDGEGDADPWLHANGYAKDDFVVSDEEAEEDAFAPRFPHRRPPPRRRQQTLDELGPPISRDSRIDEARLDEIHQDIVHAFAERANELDESLRNRHGLRRPIFTEQQHQEMAIRWTTTVHQMYTIRGVDKTKVDLYGARFAALVRQFYTQYQEMMGGKAAKPFSAVVSAAEMQRRDRDLINLVSDDEDNAEDRNTGSGRAFRFGDEPRAEEEASEGGG